MTAWQAATAGAVTIGCIPLAAWAVDAGFDPVVILLAAGLGIAPWLVLLAPQPAQDVPAGGERGASPEVSRPERSPIESAPIPIQGGASQAVPAPPPTLPNPSIATSTAAVDMVEARPDTVPARSDRPRQTRTPPPNELRPLQHYERHSTTPGFLYVAVNALRASGVFKLGYTTACDPDERMRWLTDQCQSGGKDVGEFQVLRCVRVSESYNTEQLLFDALSSRRIFPSKEFFAGSVEEFAGALVAAAACEKEASLEPLRKFISDGGLSDFLPQFPVARPQVPPCPRYGVAILRNPFHSEDVHLLIAGAKLGQAVARLNKRQWELTSQIGEYWMTHVVAVESIENARELMKAFAKASGSMRVAKGRNFYRSPCKALSVKLEALSKERVGTSAPPPPPPRVPTSTKAWIEEMGEPPPTLRCVPIAGSSDPTWSAWTLDCTCGMKLRVLGAIAAVGLAECPNCKQTRLCRQGPREIVPLEPWS